MRVLRGRVLVRRTQDPAGDINRGLEQDVLDSLSGFPIKNVGNDRGRTSGMTGGNVGHNGGEVLCVTGGVGQGAGA